jgi:hypothetical protein
MTTLTEKWILAFWVGLAVLFLAVGLVDFSSINKATDQYGSTPQNNCRDKCFSLNGSNPSISSGLFNYRCQCRIDGVYQDIGFEAKQTAKLPTDGEGNVQ